MSPVAVGLSIANTIIGAIGAFIHFFNAYNHPTQQGRNIYRVVIGVLSLVAVGANLLALTNLVPIRIELIVIASLAVSSGSLLFGLAEWKRN